MRKVLDIYMSIVLGGGVLLVGLFILVHNPLCLLLALCNFAIYIIYIYKFFIEPRHR